MTSAEIRAFCERFAKAWERGDVGALTACYADDGEVLSPIFQTLHGRTEIEASFRDLFQAFAEWSIRINDIIIDGEGSHAALVWTSQLTPPRLHLRHACERPAPGERGRAHPDTQEWPHRVGAPDLRLHPPAHAVGRAQGQDGVAARVRA